MGLVLVMNLDMLSSTLDPPDFRSGTFPWILQISKEKTHFSSPVFLGDVASAKDKELLLMVSFKKKWDLVSSTSKNCRAKSWFSVNHVTLLLFYVSVGSMDKNLFI